MESKLMHDWVLKSIEVAWEAGSVRFDLNSGPGVTKKLVARGLIELVVPRREEWGRSVCIMSSTGPEPLDNGQRLEILMQSGDSILIIARDIAMPSIV